MANLTREKVIKINEACKNDFELDLQYYMFHKEYMLEKNISIDDENYIKASIGYHEYYDRSKGYPRYTGKYQIYVNVSQWYHKKGDNFASSSGLGKYLYSEELYDRKTIKSLEDYTRKITDDIIWAIYEDNKEQIQDARII